MPQLALLLTTINDLTTIAPNLALSKHVLIQNMISSKLQDDKRLKDDDIAKIADCSNHAVRRIQSKILLFRSTKTPLNGASQPKTITPPMLTALYDQLSIDPCIRLSDIAAFLQKECVNAYTLPRSNIVP